MYPGIYRQLPHLHNKRVNHGYLDMFTCKYCQAEVYTQPLVSGVQNRNHCPYCLCSRHLDHYQAGDRLSACKAIMQPIGLTVKHSRNKYQKYGWGELMLIHRCEECGKISINRIAADDQADRLMEVYRVSLGLAPDTRRNLDTSGIQLLQEDHIQLVVSQLEGIHSI